MGQFGHVNIEGASKDVILKEGQSKTHNIKWEIYTYPEATKGLDKLVIFFISDNTALDYFKKSSKLIGADHIGAPYFWDNTHFIAFGRDYKKVFNVDILKENALFFSKGKTDKMFIMNEYDNTAKLFENHLLPGYRAGFRNIGHSWIEHYIPGGDLLINEDQIDKTVRVLSERQAKMYLNTLNKKLKNK